MTKQIANDLSNSTVLAQHSDVLTDFISKIDNHIQEACDKGYYGVQVWGGQDVARDTDTACMVVDFLLSFYRQRGFDTTVSDTTTPGLTINWL